MPFKKKPYLRVGNLNSPIFIPRPPSRATHVHLECVDERTGAKQRATLPIRDFDCLDGTAGEFHYLRMDKSRKVIEKYPDKYQWDGKKVEGIEDLIKE